MLDRMDSTSRGSMIFRHARMYRMYVLKCGRCSFRLRLGSDERGLPQYQYAALPSSSIAVSLPLLVYFSVQSQSSRLDSLKNGCAEIVVLG